MDDDPIGGCRAMLICSLIMLIVAFIVVIIIMKGC